MEKIKIGIATHKEYQMPDDEIYLPIQSGAAINQKNLGYAKDDSGDNISDKNLNYCELTALYWLWKNIDADYKGLVHYRRHFSKKSYVNMFSTGNFNDVLDDKTVRELLETSDIILPQLRKYYIETIESHYNHTHHEQDLIVIKKVLSNLHPEYLDSFKLVLNKKSAHMFNMFIMKDNHFNSYCEWLFPILFELERQLDISGYSAFHQRVFGRVSEILLDVWIEYNQLDYAERPVMFMEKQSWSKKIMNFFTAKMLHKKY